LDGCLRVGFASGTPTHTRDFGTIAESLADFLADNPNARFVLVGYLDLTRFPCLLPHKDRIECRPAVPLANLFAELAQFDINLAPLEVGNPFCEAKSEIRYTAAAALGIPTIASATAPMRHAIIDRETGLLAAEAGDWRGLLQQLSDDPALRAELGGAARIDTRMRFGPEKTERMAKISLSAVFGGIESARRILEPQLSNQTLVGR
jgi:glycosyltransferase involved in cell wall biosynthesis